MLCLWNECEFSFCLVLSRPVVDRCVEFSAELYALFEAAHGNDAALVKELLGRGISANAVEPEKSTPIFAAAYVAHTHDTASRHTYSLPHPAANAPGRRHTNTHKHPLTFLVCSAAGSLEAAQALLAEGADLRRRDATGATPLHVAALHGQEKLVEWLLEHGADVSAEGAALA